MNKYFKEILNSPAEKNINRHEQTIHASLLSKCKAKRLSKYYQISKMNLTRKTVSRHFVNDGGRDNFYLRRLKKLKDDRFLEKLNGPEIY